MSIQSGINQLIGMSMMATRLNPEIEEAARHRSELRKVEKQESVLSEQIESLAPSIAEQHEYMSGLNDLMETDPKYAKDVMASEDYKNRKLEAEATGELLTNIEEGGLASAQKRFELQPSEETASNLLDWQKARIKREQAMKRMQEQGKSQIKQRDDFKKFQEKILGEEYASVPLQTQRVMYEQYKKGDKR